LWWIREVTSHNIIDRYIVLCIIEEAKPSLLLFVGRTRATVKAKITMKNVLKLVCIAIACLSMCGIAEGTKGPKTECTAGEDDKNVTC
jgi:hypothetical protein